MSGILKLRKGKRNFKVFAVAVVIAVRRLVCYMVRWMMEIASSNDGIDVHALVEKTSSDFLELHSSKHFDT